MKLIGTETSPFVRKVRIVLEEKRIPYEYVRARAAAPGSPVPQLNPLGKVPVLVRDNGAALYDSPVIVEYLDELVPEPRLIPQSFEERIEVKRWEALGDGITESTVAISHDRRKPQERWELPEWHEKHRLKIDRSLALMEQDLNGREFCHGSRFSLADIAAGYALGYIDAVLPEIDWRKDHPHLKRLSDTLATRPSFRETAHPSA
jgi:glutathione S-transferase